MGVGCIMEPCLHGRPAPRRQPGSRSPRRERPTYLQRKAAAGAGGRTEGPLSGPIMDGPARTVLAALTGLRFRGTTTFLSAMAGVVVLLAVHILNVLVRASAGGNEKRTRPCQYEAHDAFHLGSIRSDGIIVRHGAYSGRGTENVFKASPEGGRRGGAWRGRGHFEG